MNEAGWRPWLPEGIAALIVFTIGATEAVLFWAMTGARALGLAQVLLALVIATAVGMFRREPGAALALLWGLGLLHVVYNAPFMAIEAVLVAVFFGGARWGRTPTVVASALSVPLTVIVVFILQESRSVTIHLLFGGSKLGGLIRQEPVLELTVYLLALVAVAIPWPAGLVTRLLDRERTSRAAVAAAEEDAARAWRETEHVREIVHLRDQQTRLARDVHDVVGHSLAVILAQAESGQYIDDTERLKSTLQTIATSARSSLQDVREVLSSTQDPAPVPGGRDRFDSLIVGVRGSGHEIVATEVGTPRQLPRETAAVAYRVFQEMLTNAIKHGRRDRPITTERHWPDDKDADTLRIEVTNMTDADGNTGTGRGLDGMRRRLEEIGGHLDVRPDGTRFTVTAFVPVRGGA